MKAKKILAISTCIVLLTALVGCTKNSVSSIPKPTIPMKTVSQNSKGDYVSFDCALPENWSFLPMDYDSICGADPSSLGKNFDTEEEGLPYYIIVESYARLNETDAEIPQVFKDLFAGKPELYKNHINTYVAHITQQETYENTNSALEPPTSVLNIFDLMQTTENSSQDFFAKGDYLKDFKYDCYNGKNGKIAEVQYSFEYKGKTYRQIKCIREDIPYMVSGGFDDSLNLSSGEVALWAADSLKVTKNSP